VTAVTVIGAGPAGALAAALLAKQGVEVTLVEKSAFPRHKVCGCCLSPTAVAMLEKAGFSGVAEELKAVPLKQMQLHFRSSRMTLPLVHSKSISRAALDQALVREAVSAGAVFLPETSATIESIAKYGCNVEIGDESFTSKVVIAADGLSGTSLRKLSSMRTQVAPNSKVGTGSISARDSSSYEDGTIYMCVGDGGYVGMVRLEDGALDIAAALEPEYLRKMHNPSDAIVRILRSCKLEIPKDIHELDWKGTVALTRQRERVASRRVFAIGDCAGYVEPFTGEGIAWAFTAALNVVPLAARGSTIWSDALARDWQRIYFSEVRARQGRTAMVAGFLDNKFLRLAGAEMLSRVPALSPLLVRAVSCTK
jgi:menaquinone-9 beta-reductase